MTTNSDVIEKFIAEASRSGAKILVAGNRDEAAAHISSLAKSKNITTVVKARCPLAGRLELPQHMEKSGINVCETSLVQWTLQLKQQKDVPLEEVAALVSTATGEKVGNDPEEILKAAKKALKAVYESADLGITEADFGIAETGTLITMENEGNARLAAVLPRLHLTLLDANHVVASLADVTEMIKQTSGGIPGHAVPTFITYLTGRNTTADIPDALFSRAQGPAEEYILIIREI
jgi:L-lactate dehydrogenase complex protein LldF